MEPLLHKVSTHPSWLVIFLHLAMQHTAQQ